MITTEGTVPFPLTDPPAVDAFRTTCAALVEALHSAVAQLTSASALAAGAWTGEAADAFQQHMAAETAAVTTLAGRLAGVLPAIATYTAKMKASELAYNTAVQRQIAAIAEGAAGLGDEAVAIAQEGLAVVELEAAGAICAAVLTGVSAQLMVSALPGLSPATLVEAASDLVKGFTSAGGEAAEDMTRVVAGYTKKTGTVVASYVRYAEGLGAKYGSELKAGTLRAAGDVAEKASVAAKWVGGAAVVVETVERDRELVHSGVPEPYAAAEAVVGRVGPAAAGMAAGAATEAAVESAGTVAGAAAGSEIPVAGTAAGAVAGAVAASAPAVVAGAAVSFGVSQGTQFGADWITDRINAMAFDIKPEGPRSAVPPPSEPAGP